MPFNEYFVRPINGNDVPGGGTSHETAYKSIQYACGDIGTTHGARIAPEYRDRINVNSLEGQIVTPVTIDCIGYPAANPPLHLEGYAASPGDGGIADISGGGVITPLHPMIQFNGKNLKIGNSGAAPALDLNNDYTSGMMNCEMYGSSSYLLYNTQASYLSFINCHFRTDQEIQYPIEFSNYRCTGVSFDGCYFNTPHATGSTIWLRDSSGLFNRCIFRTGQTAISAYRNTNIFTKINHCSFLGPGAAAVSSFLYSYSTNVYKFALQNILAEGYRYGIGSNEILSNCIFHGSLYDVTYPNWLPARLPLTIEDYEILEESPFMKTGEPTFENRFNYFAPKPVGNVIGGALDTPYVDRGAVQSSGIEPPTVVSRTAPVWE